MTSYLPPATIAVVLLMVCTEVPAHSPAEHPFLTSSHRESPLVSFPLQLAPSSGNSFPSDAAARKYDRPQERGPYPFVYRLSGAAGPALADLPDDAFGKDDEFVTLRGDGFLLKSKGLKESGDAGMDDVRPGDGGQGGLTVAKRRKGPTLSVVNPVEVLRHRLMLDMARKIMQDNAHQIQANAELLETLGKRSAPYQKNKRWAEQSRR